MRRSIRLQAAGVCTALAVLLILSGCGFSTQIQTRNYYILSYTPSTRLPASSQHPYNLSLQVSQFEVQRIFNRQNILYRYSPHQIQYYELQQWAVRPDLLVTDVVQQHLEAANLTNRIGNDFFDQRPDYRLDGTVEALEKLDAGDLFYGHLAMTFKLVRVSDGVQVWDYSFDQRRQVYQPEMVYTVRSLTAILQSELDVVTTQLDSVFLAVTAGVTTPTAAPEDVPDEMPDTDVSEDGIDESAFEIIPENR